jgi:hypothetical protein
MACCGQSRTSFRTGRRFSSGAGGGLENASAIATFEYTGSSGMTVVGPISGVKYRFAAPGSRVQIHWRDVPSMEGVPNLRRAD